MNTGTAGSEITVEYNLEGLNQKARDSVTEVLDYIDRLNERGGQDPQILTLENLYFNKIMESLREGISRLSDDERAELGKKLDEMSGGLYDLETIDFLSPASSLILGKVYSAQNSYQKKYGGVFGIVNSDANGWLDKYDEVAESFYQSFSYIPENKKEIFNEKKSSINCLDVLRFAGDFNLVYKPISLFYTGIKYENMPVKQKVALFTNIYFKRYELISEQLGKKFINGYYTPKQISREEINKTLVYWLRGHDIGHFFGRDLLGEKMQDIMKKEIKDNRRIYYILHELKSDVISLYLLKNKLSELFDGQEMLNIYQIYFSELFRYLRRGSYLHYADGGSAYLAYRYFLDSGAISVDRKHMHDIDLEQISSDIEKLCEDLIDLFEEGNSVKAVDYVNNLVNIEDMTKKELPEQLEFLNDLPIPVNVNIQNNSIL